MVSEVTRTQEELIARYIGKPPHKSGLENHWLVDDGIPVWAIIGYMQGQGLSVEETAAEYGVPVEAIQAAVSFYARHKAVIDNRIDG